MSPAFPAQIQLNGRPATAEDLAPLAFAGFAHFTAMQLRDGGVRGLDLHLARLRSASLEFFGQAMPDEKVLACLRAAVADGPADMSLTATMFSRSGEFTKAGTDNDPAILVRTAPPSDGPPGPLRLMAVEHERPLASIKHAGEAAKTFYLRQAVKRGFDDAAFADRSGRISEATIWNLAFWDGEMVLWPDAVVLPGITMQIVLRQLDRLDIPQRRAPITLEHLKHLKGAAVMNSWTPGIAVAGIADVDLAASQSLIDILHRAYGRENPAIL